MTLLAVTLILTPLTWWTFRRSDEFHTAHARERGLHALARLCTPAPTPEERDVPRPARATAQRAPVGEDDTPNSQTGLVK
jgi:hypothetical protein